MTVLLTYVKDIPDSKPQKFLTVTTNYGPCYKIFVTSLSVSYSKSVTVRKKYKCHNMTAHKLADTQVN